LFSSISAFVHPGDEVILFDPSYDSYDPAIRLCGGKPLRLALEPPSFNIDWDQVERSITPRTRMIMINTPHNPTGRILHDDDLRSLERLVLKHGLLVLSDEVYERIIFDGAMHQSVLRYEGLRSQSIAVFSLDRKSTRLNSSHVKISYAVFCL